MVMISPPSSRYLFKRHAGVEIPHPLADTACIQLNSLSLFQNLKQNGIQDIFIFFIGIIPVHGSPIADNVIQMPIDIKIGINLQIIQNGLEIFPVCLLVGATFKKGRIVRVFSVADMGGNGNKVEGKELAYAVFCQAR